MASSRAKKSTNSGKRQKTAGKKTQRSTSKRMTKAESERIALEEKRAMEVKRDIRLLVLFGVYHSAFCYIKYGKEDSAGKNGSSCDAPCMRMHGI